jgi:hypothetical protein
MSGLYTALGAVVIGGGMALTKKNPWSPKDVKGSIGINSPLQPGAPPVMPDQASVLQDQQIKEAKDAALRYGRASTVLTGSGQSNTAGDQLGP